MPLFYAFVKTFPKKSRQSESLQELDQRFFICITKRCLIVIARPEVVAAVDDIIRALTQAHQLRCEWLEDFSSAVVVILFALVRTLFAQLHQIASDSKDHLLQLFIVLKAVPEAHLFGP